MLPPSFSERLKQQLGEEAFHHYTQALEEEAPVSIRLNPAKWDKDLSLAPIPWASKAYYLPNRPTFALDPRWHAGAYYVQEASSMLLEQAIKQHVPMRQDLRALDLCGAPGGKSSHLASLLPPDSLLVANEVIKGRATILSENLQKWGTGNAIITSNDPKKLGELTGFFDLLVIDAPCSGEGLFRKDLAARTEWSEANARLCTERQRRILQDVWPALRPGGILVYSTCTYNPAENEENLSWLSSQQAVNSLPIQIPAGYTTAIEEIGYQNMLGYRCMPQRVAGEGFFICVLRKEDGRNFSYQKARKNKWELADRKLVNATSGWLAREQQIWQFCTSLYALPNSWQEDFRQLANKVYMLYAGTALAEVKGKNINPHAAFALSVRAQDSAFLTYEASLEEALRFLRKDDLLPDTAVKGWLRINYQGLGLGWLKHLGNRTNNYWPTEWRLRMLLPEQLEPSLL